MPMHNPVLLLSLKRKFASFSHSSRGTVGHSDGDIVGASEEHRSLQVVGQKNFTVLPGLPVPG